MAGGPPISLAKDQASWPEAFAGMRKAGRLVAECLDMLVPEIRSGLTTEHIDRSVFEFAIDCGAMPATLMYRGYAWVAGVRSARCH
jgi:methionine aminopeptidase